MLITLVVAMILQAHSYVKIYQIVPSSVCSLLYVNYTSVKLLLRPTIRRLRCFFVQFRLPPWFEKLALEMEDTQPLFPIQ